MEKLESMTKQEKIVGIISTTKGKYIIGTMLFSVLGIVLPRIFHVLAGNNAGVIFLPMHIAVMIAAIVFGVRSSSIVAVSSILFSYLLTGMPLLERLPYMLIELLIYAVLLRVFSRKYNSYVALILTIVIGRILYAGVLSISGNLLGLLLYNISVLESVKVSIVGIILQIVCIPFISAKLKEGLKLHD